MTQPTDIGLPRAGSPAASVVVRVLVCDYANVDAVSKINMLGAAWQLTSVSPQTGMLPPQTVVVIIAVPPEHLNEQFAVSLSLKGPDGAIVEVPGPTGEMQALRIQQLVHADAPRPPGVVIPPGAAPGQVQMVTNFAGGLPVPTTGLYSWVLEVDGNTNPQWQADFYVVGPPPGPVIG